MYTVQVKQFSGLIKYSSVLEKHFYIAGQKLPQLKGKSNDLHKPSDTQTTLIHQY